MARIVATVWLCGMALAAQALQVGSMSPQGEVAQVRQLVLRFDEPVVPAGNPEAPAPARLQCSDSAAAAGNGRWLNERQWVFDFRAELPPGVRCSLQLLPDLQSAAGGALRGTTTFRFQTGGPAVRSIRPYPGSAVDEDQVFVLQLNGPATLQSLQASLWCAVDGLGERVPVRLVEGEVRNAILRALQLEKAASGSPLSIATLSCNRRLTPATKMQLVYGRGVVSPAPPGGAPGGMPASVERRFAFTVREPFSATFSCESENAQAGCMPIKPMRLDFSAPVARALADAVRLRGPAGEVGPTPEAPTPGGGDALVNQIEFKGPFAETAAYTLVLPPKLQDAAGRPLRNADSFPLRVATAALPPLAKFAAGPFGIVERFAEADGTVLFPVTVRKVEGAAAGPAAVRDLALASDADIIAWYRRVQRYDAPTVSRRSAAADVQGPLPRSLGNDDKEQVQSRMLSLLKGHSGVRTLALPQAVAGDPRPFEVVGIPMSPGFHVVEIASPLLGASLLDPAHGAGRTMYVRSSALVTNLAVHFKLGRENALAWVTTLDKGQPVAQARVRVSDCNGREVASAVTDARGLASLTGVPPEAPACTGEGYTRAWFVSARAAQPATEGGKGSLDDLAFTWSDWQRGIEPWRFNVPTSQESQPDLRAHTILDRPLLRVGETLGMKHLLRSATGKGFGTADDAPTTLHLTHVGSGQEITQPLVWRRTATGGQSAESSVSLAPGSKLGLYQITLGDARGQRSIGTAQFRVEEFRLPVLQGSVGPAERQKPLVNPSALPLAVEVHYVSGGPAAKLPVQVSALVRDKFLAFEGFDRFSFAPPRPARSGTDAGDEEDAGAAQNQQVVADKLPLALDGNGSGNLRLDKLPPTTQPRELQLEASYADPNGEIQTLRSTHALWPAAVVAGIQAQDWASSGSRLRIQALALDLEGRPRAGVPLEVRGMARIVTSSRKRLVGGFYAYDNHTEQRDLGVLCSGKSDAQGLLPCEATLRQPGEVELVAQAADSAGNLARAATSAYITREGELWFGGENHDRMDVLPERREYQPGETARLQVRMPFRHATALVAVEREGVMQTQLVALRGNDPTIELKVGEDWGPNVYVSVLALRGRLRDVPWYSFFTWGYKAPREWWTQFWYDGRAYTAPTALVDLSKPAFRLGMAELRIGARAHRLDVEVKADQASYPVRGTVQVSLRVRLPNGQPAAHAEVALAAVDEALLELMPNDSWNLLEAMLQRRAWGVETSTAQMEIVGRRHYGRKAVPAGGGGGRAGARELLDTLLLWNPRVVLDAQGQARVAVPLNDALTRFRIVAVADASLGLFGTGQTSIRSAQDLQIISGLPPLVREGDRFRAQFTLRNTTARDMQVTLQARAAPLAPPPQTLALPAGQAREVFWDLQAPTPAAGTAQDALAWEIEARDAGSAARDALKLRQKLAAAVPVTVQQANLLQLDAPWSLPVQPPPSALPGRGGLKLGLQATLANADAGGLPALRDWFLAYPYACLEQMASKAIGLRDPARWQALLAQMPAYLDGDGLAYYFPPADGAANQGSDTLTAYLLSASAEAAALQPDLALPEPLRSRMAQALVAFVEGRIERRHWSPQTAAGTDLDVRKLAALEALSRHGLATGRMTTSITLAPNQWPTHAVIDWLAVLRRVADVPQRAQRLAEATQILRSRISQQGTRLVFSTEAGDAWWWQMQNGDANAARVLLAAVDDPAWKDEAGKLASGLIGRQQRGTWSTTTANVWASLALEKFSRRFESEPVAGTTQARLGPATASLDWQQPPPRSLFLPWPEGTGAPATVTVSHQGSGRPWLTMQALAAVPRLTPASAGYTLERSVALVDTAGNGLPPGSYRRGDILRVTLDINASADMAWAVLSDAIPAGATILGSGLGRDAQSATAGEKREGRAWPAFEERSFEAFRAYYEWLPKGRTRVQYTVRLNNVGEFSLPPSRVEAMYAPEMFGELPGTRVRVLAP